MSALRHNRSLCVPALLGTLLVCLCLKQVGDADIWFYLVAARQVVESGQIPPSEFYVYPAQGEAAHYSALGFGLLHYFAQRLAGTTGMALLNALLCGLSLLSLYRAAHVAAQERLPLPVAMAVLALVFSMADFRMVFRPETTLFLCLAIAIGVLERWLADGRAQRLLIIPLLAWLLGQLHTTAIMLLPVLGAYGLHGLTTGAIRRSGWVKPLSVLAACGLLTVLLPLANPYGLEQATLLVRSLFSAISTPDGNVEYLPVLDTEYRFHFIGLAGLTAAVWLGCRERRLVDLLMLLGFGWLAFRFVRNLGLFALVAVVPLSLGLSQLWLRLRASHSAVFMRTFALFLLAVALCLPLVTLQKAGNWGVGLQAEKYPLKGIEAIRAVAPGGNVLNFFHHGSYLAWALGNSYKVAIDGHFVTPTRAHSYHDAMFRAAPGWRQAVLDERVVAIVTPATLPFSGAMIPLVVELASSPDWRLAAVDPEALTFLPMTSAGPSLQKNEIWHQVMRETLSAMRENPDPQAAEAARRLAMSRLDGAP